MGANRQTWKHMALAAAAAVLFYGLAPACGGNGGRRPSKRRQMRPQQDGQPRQDMRASHGQRPPRDNNGPREGLN